MSYIINPLANTSFISGNGEAASVDLNIFESALDDVHAVIDLIIKDIPVNIFAVLGMRNLSGFIGELFAISLIKASNGQFIGNPHQDGYPDLLLMNDYGKILYARLTEAGQLRYKAPFSPFANGGLEIKATCGDVFSAEKCAKRGIEKPDIGDTRIELMEGYNWKSHHRETKNLLGILWDFYMGVPHIVAVFFGNNLTESDWRPITQPKEGGGRTTSVSPIAY